MSLSGRSRTESGERNSGEVPAKAGTSLLFEATHLFGDEQNFRSFANPSRNPSSGIAIHRMATRAMIARAIVAGFSRFAICFYRTLFAANGENLGGPKFSPVSRKFGTARSRFATTTASSK